ncbi:hypothetical protein [Hahella sp. CCB-MM4]|uniref:hypothetical protein n=1 Tax=Hahella sp. (strain CCB-MM4) TaxID=1926491 RepID=UPI001AF01914|nr:hypothetical protein [Hahella sp. CCB-MM4]
MDIGASFDTWSNVVLYEGVPGSWYSQQPAACAGSGGGNDCQDWNATNLIHQMAGRAYYAFGYYTLGGNDYIGAFSGTTSWVKESSSGIYEAGQCE